MFFLILNQTTSFKRASLRRCPLSFGKGRHTPEATQFCCIIRPLGDLEEKGQGNYSCIFTNEFHLPLVLTHGGPELLTT